MARMEPPAYPLLRSQAAVLAVILDYVAEGYTWHLTSSTPETKILRTVDLLHQKHRVLAGAEDQRLRRVAGVARARLVLAPEPKGGRWPYVLLGDRKLAGEGLREVTKTPVTWPAFRSDTQQWQETYELRRHPDSARWTWWLTRPAFEELMRQVVEAAEAGEWERVVNRLVLAFGLPAFRGVREQMLKLLKAAHHTWGDRQYRSAGGKWGSPPWRSLELPRAISPVRTWRYFRQDEAPGRPRTLGEWIAQAGGQA